MNQLITINSRKFDYSIHKSWQCQLLEESADYWLFVGEFDQEIQHSKLGIIRRGTISYEYYWKEKWFNIFHLHELEGDLKYYYCNINLPPTFANNILDYVDLDLDVLVQNDFTFEILDEEEFEQNSKLFGYPNGVILGVKNSLDELLEMVKMRVFPFNVGVS